MWKRQKKIFLILALAMAILAKEDMKLVGKFQPRMLRTAGEDSGSEKINIKSKRFSGRFSDIQWCGEDENVLFILTTEGDLQRSTDGGFSYKSMKNSLQGNIPETAFKNSNKKKVISEMIQNPADPNIFLFRGESGFNWITEDCGGKVKVFGTARKLENIMFHPLERTWVLASSWTDCTKVKGKRAKKKCKRKQQLLYSDDLTKTWKVLENYITQFSWALNDVRYTNIDVPQERIIVAYMPHASGDQQTFGWSNQISIAISDNLFKTSHIVVYKGNQFVIQNMYIFVAKVQDQTAQDVELMVSSAILKNYKFEKVQLPSQRLSEHGYTILDTEEGQVFLHINHAGDQTNYGNIYISGAKGIRYSKSLMNNVRDTQGACDFERVQSLEGVYLANVFENDAVKMFQSQSSSKSSAFIDTEDVYRKKGQRKRNYQSSKLNSLQKKAKLKQFKKTVISFDKGGIWEPIEAPYYDSTGKTIKCEDDSCSLHLNSNSDNKFGPFYSVGNAIGLIISTGNIGTYLTTRQDEINTYLSRDGGLNWFEIRKGSHTYEIGDHGGLIVLGNDQKATNKVHYSYDEGQTWKVLEFSDYLMEIDNIVIKPSNTGQLFVVHGVYTNAKTNKKYGQIVSLDFSELHPRVCVGDDSPNEGDSDYETWTPSSQKRGNCILGRQTTYTRKKRDVECFNALEWEQSKLVKNCACTEENWECDFGYQRNGDSSCMPETDDDGFLIDIAPETCVDYFQISQGYRKVAGDTCQGGIDHSQRLIKCPNAFFSKQNLTYLIIMMLVGLLVYLIRNNSTSLAECFEGLKVKFKLTSKKHDWEYKYKQFVKNPETEDKDFTAFTFVDDEPNTLIETENPQSSNSDHEEENDLDEQEGESFDPNN